MGNANGCSWTIQLRGNACGERLFSGLFSGSTTSRSWVLMEMMGSGSWAAVGDDTGLAEDPEPIPNLAQKLIASLVQGTTAL